jgi:hypothetical protein
VTGDPGGVAEVVERVVDERLLDEQEHEAERGPEQEAGGYLLGPELVASAGGAAANGVGSCRHLKSRLYKEQFAL